MQNSHVLNGLKIKEKTESCKIYCKTTRHL